MRREKIKYAQLAAKHFQPVSLNLNSTLLTIQLQFLSPATRLKEHNVSAHSIAPKDFACEFCAKQFLTLRQLKNHQVYHEEPKFSCKFCNKNFYKSVLLDGHHKTHLEQKDYSCTICDQKYFLKSHLNRHIRSVHDKIK